MHNHAKTPSKILFLLTLYLFFVPPVFFKTYFPKSDIDIGVAPVNIVLNIPGPLTCVCVALFYDIYPNSLNMYYFKEIMRSWRTEELKNFPKSDINIGVAPVNIVHNIPGPSHVCVFLVL